MVQERMWQKIYFAIDLVQEIQTDFVGVLVLTLSELLKVMSYKFAKIWPIIYCEIYLKNIASKHIYKIYIFEKIYSSTQSNQF